MKPAQQGRCAPSRFCIGRTSARASNWSLADYIQMSEVQLEKTDPSGDLVKKTQAQIYTSLELDALRRTAIER